MAHREQPELIDAYFWRVFRFGLRLLWAAALAWIPLAQREIADGYWKAIGCPPVGECYVDGWLLLDRMEDVSLASAALLWPYCAWLALVQPVLQLVRRAKTDRSRASTEPGDASNTGVTD